MNGLIKPMRRTITVTMPDSVTLQTTSLLEQLSFLPVPAGNAVLGLEDKIAERFISSYGEVWSDFFCREQPQHEVEVAAFELGRYPVTNGIYAQFMAAGGYTDARFWTPEGWAWRLQTGRLQPAFWNDPKFAGADRPVVGVSWFEALALARWAAIVTGANIRLPTEAEWEWAARPKNSKSLYPWDGAWDPTRLNSGYTDAKQDSKRSTATVGVYSPQGDGPFGHSDLLGQVWEWTSSAFKLYPYIATDGREDLYAPERRMLRGGNWSDGKYTNRVTARYLYPAYYGDATTGFRLAMGGSRPPIAQRFQHDLVMYGRSSFCPDLVNVKKWLHDWNIPYRQLNIDMDEQAAFRLDTWLGSRTVPTLVIAPLGSIDPVDPPADANLSNLRNADRGSMLHEADESTLRTFLLRHGFLSAQ
jgi:formylglycine-generating enzyme required for sulfatase activity/glutaredoxin